VKVGERWAVIRTRSTLVAVVHVADSSASWGVLDAGQWNDESFRWPVVAVGHSLLSIVITVACNVPRDDALGTLNPTARSTTSAWADHVTSGTMWNSSRTFTSAASSVGYELAVRGR